MWQSSDEADSSSSDLNALLHSDALASKRNEIKTTSIIYRVSGAVSLVAYILLVVYLLLKQWKRYKMRRRRINRSIPIYERLHFGLSISGMMSSLAYVLSSSMVPEELNYIEPYAKGSVRSCDAQGFLIYVGNSMMCL